MGSPGDTNILIVDDRADSLLALAAVLGLQRRHATLEERGRARTAELTKAKSAPDAEIAASQVAGAARMQLEAPMREQPEPWSLGVLARGVAHQINNPRTVDDGMRITFALTSPLERQQSLVSYADYDADTIALPQSSTGMAVVLMDPMTPAVDCYEGMRRIGKIREYRQLPIIAVASQAT